MVTLQEHVIFNVKVDKVCLPKPIDAALTFTTFKALL